MSIAQPATPLEGLQIIDLTHMLAGPYCTWVLGGLGADVVKVEAPGRGDFTRTIAPFVDDTSLYFSSVNRNKRSLTVNLKTERGRAILRRLVEGGDVLVENSRPGVMERLQLDYARLAAYNPRLVYASISGFGQTGPYRARPAFDLVIQALSGMMSVTGEMNGSAVRVGASIGDIAASLFASIGILAALQQRDRTGRGAHIDVSMLDCQLAILENAFARYLNTGDVPQRLGSRHPLIAPFQAFATADEPMVICVDTDAQWTRLCHAVGRPDLLTDPRFHDGNARVRYRDELETILEDVLRGHGRTEWLRVLEEADVPCGPINSIPDAARDRQVVARQMIVRVPPESETRYCGVPIRLGPMPSSEAAAPGLGEHTDEILGELGFSSEEIRVLRADRIV